MPEMTGLELLQALRDEQNEVAVIIFSMYDDLHMLRRALEYGAKGYLTKDAEAVEIIRTITEVYEGKNSFSVNIEQQIIADFSNANKDDHLPEVPLTEREVQVLRQVMEGLTSKEIASDLYISIRTVETHRNNILKKLKLKNSAELVKYVIKHNLLGHLN